MTGRADCMRRIFYLLLTDLPVFLNFRYPPANADDFRDLRLKGKNPVPGLFSRSYRLIVGISLFYSVFCKRDVVVKADLDLAAVFVFLNLVHIAGLDFQVFADDIS